MEHSVYDDITIEDVAVPPVPGHEHVVPVAEALSEDDDLEVPVGVSPGPPATGDEKKCRIKLPDGCYRLAYRPSASAEVFRGTVRVDRGEGKLIISGDLYRFLPGLDASSAAAASATFNSVALAGVFADVFDDSDIPVYPRARYHSYLKGTGAQLQPTVRSDEKCRAILSFDQYDYTQPPSGQFNGTFPAAPGSRAIQLRLTPDKDSDDSSDASFEGELVEGGIVRGTVKMRRVSAFFRRCTIEVDTVQGAVPPQAVPALSGSGKETFRTMLASAGWLASVVYDQAALPSPIPDPTVCWTDGDLHGLMQQVRATTNLDAEWRLHLLVVQGRITCSRGKMYDSIVVPREGVVSYSDDGYPASHSANFGTAEGQMQRNVPRAFLRSASHELVHGFNQIHQEQEGGADNSIMTTTPSVADVLGGPTSGDPGVFPDAIKLRVNQHVRHHMIHFPDPIVRPGGHTFGSGHISIVPEADKYAFGPGELAMEITAEHEQVALGEPVLLSWTVTNTGSEHLPVPSDVGTEALYASVAVIDLKGRRRSVRPFVIDCEATHISDLAPGESRRGHMRVFWSTSGFAFTAPGPHRIEVSIDWTARGVPCTVKSSVPLFVAFPSTAADNDAAATLLHPDVGKWVALGGNAPHLTEAVGRLRSLVSMGERGDRRGVAVEAPAALRGYRGLLPLMEPESGRGQTRQPEVVLPGQQRPTTPVL